MIANHLPLDDDLVLNFHLMHPGGGSIPGDPNAAFYPDGTCHLHYILSFNHTGSGLASRDAKPLITWPVNR